MDRSTSTYPSPKPCIDNRNNVPFLDIVTTPDTNLQVVNTPMVPNLYTPMVIYFTHQWWLTFVTQWWLILTLNQPRSKMGDQAFNIPQALDNI